MIKFGIVGTGKMAATMMAAFKHLPDVKVIAVSSESTDRAKDFSLRFDIPKSYGSLSELLNDQEIDAVYVANATECHASSSIQAMKSGKSVLCEKPIATSVAESKLVEAESVKSGQLCMEAMWTHFLPAYQRLFGLELDRSLGEPIHLFADFGYPANRETHPRLFTPSSGSGVLLDRGVYPIALSLKLFGAVERITSQVEFNEDGVDTHACLILSHQNGCYSQLAVSMHSLLQNRAVLSFTEGSVSLEPPVLGAETVEIQHFHHDQVSHAHTSSFKDRLKQQLKQSSFLRRMKSKKSGGQREYCSYGINQYLPMLSHYCDIYRAGKKESDVIPISLSRDVLAIVEQAKK